MLLLESAIAPALKEAGFTKKARTWWRRAERTIHVLNLQKSPYGERLHVNLGIYVTQLGVEESPRESRCHIQARLERIADPTREQDVLSAVADVVPTSGLVAAVLIDGLAWFEMLSTLTGMRRYIESGGSKNGLVFATVRELVANAE